MNEYGGTLYATAGWLWAGNYGSPTTGAWLGLRFRNVNVPRNAAIQSAQLELYSSTVNQTTAVNFSVMAELTANAAAFTSTTRPSQRTNRTSAVNFTYSTSQVWAPNQTITLGGLGGIVQTLVNQSGWAANNSLAFLIQGNLTSTDARRFTRAFEYGDGNVVRLRIRYSVTPPSPTPTRTPTSTPTPTRTFTPTATPTIDPTLCTSGLQTFGSINLASPLCQEEGSGLRADYFAGTHFEVFLGSRVDSTVDSPWNTNPVPLLPSSLFSVIWTGWLRINSSNTKVDICTISDDGVRLWVNDQLVIANWYDHGETLNCASGLQLNPVGPTIRMEYYQGTGASVAKLMWRTTGSGQSPTIIPQYLLYPALFPPVLRRVPPLQYRDAISLDTVRLREIARYYPQIIWPNSAPPPLGSVLWNQGIGRGFQTWALNQLGIPENTQNFSNAIRPQQVRPDGFRPHTLVEIDPQTGEIKSTTVYPDSEVIEVKAVSGFITASYSNQQIRAMIDMSLTRPLANSGQQLGAVTLITTGNTSIADALLVEATSRRVLLCQATAWEITGIWEYFPGSTPTGSRFWLDSPTLLNWSGLVSAGVINPTCNISPVASPSTWTGVSGGYVPDINDQDPISLE